MTTQEIIDKVCEKIEGCKEVYKKGDERFYDHAQDGDVKDDIDSCCNEHLNYVIEQIKDIVKEIGE